MPDASPAVNTVAPQARSAPEVLRAFFILGSTSFGGPVAHLAYFRSEFVLRRRWLDDKAYADLVALCQLLPGPASSQVAVALGIMRAGFWGGLAAWIGFTMPSALLLTAFAYGSNGLTGTLGNGILHGLTLIAVAIVAQAVLGMAWSLCPDRQRIAIASLAAVLLLLSGAAIVQIAVLSLGGALGVLWCRKSSAVAHGVLSISIPRSVGMVALAVFVLLLAGPPLLHDTIPGVAAFNAFYRAGALVFGGGHVVLPLLSDAFLTPGWVNQQAFLSGYGATQAIPGPLFAFAAYLGAISTQSPHGVAGAILGLVAIFLPGMLILIAALSFWNHVRQRILIQAAIRGINAAVVGILGAALYTPLWTSAVHTSGDVAVVVMSFVLLTTWRVPALAVVVVGALGGIALSYMTS